MFQLSCRRLLFAAAISMSTTAVAGAQGAPETVAHRLPEITVYKNPNCGCCKNWIDHLRNHGFEVLTKEVSEMRDIKTANAVPAELASCHTALVGGYVIEGHVPAGIIEQLLREHPDIAGLAVPGMPIGAPGMEMQGREPQPYDILAFTKDGKVSVYAHVPR